MLTLKWYSSILHASTTPVGTDPLGQLVAGTLKLVGPCVTAYVGPPSRFFFPPKYIKTITLSPQQNERSKKLCWYFWPDDNTIYSKGTPIFAMKMAKRDGRWERGEVNIYYVFLIFKCVDEEAQVYERIGYAKTFCTSRRDKKRLHRLERFLAREEKTMTLTVV
jgi:hypothetical protein